ncbi:MAG: RICIN domain-containing protein [Minicystis sp.]
MQYIVEPIYANSYSYPGIDPNKRYTLAAMHSGMVASVRNGSIALEQRKWTEAPEQQWRFEKVDGKYYKIISVATGQVADVFEGSTASRVPITIYPWKGGTNQQFELGYLGSSTFWLKCRRSGKVWDVAWVSDASGAPIQQDDWNGGNNQRWRITEVLDIVNAPTYKDKVALYQHSNYQGVRKDFGLGSYDIAKMGLGGQLSSLKIPPGLRVTLYKNANFSGSTISFTTDTSYVGNDWNDQAVAILIELVATVYQNSNYGGRSQALGIGNYNVSDLTIGNDVISSIKVPVGMQVVLFQHHNFGGDAKIAMTDVPYLSDFNDKTSSIQVKMIGVIMPQEAVTFGDKIALKSHHGKYMTANAAGSVRNETSTLNEDAWLTVVRAGKTTNMHYLCYGDVIALKTRSNKYLTDRHTVVDATATEIGTWEKFVVVRSGESYSRTYVGKDDVITLRTEGIDYVRAVDNGAVDAVPTAIGAWEKWVIAARQPTAHAQGMSSCSADTSVQFFVAEPMAEAPPGQACGADACPIQLCGADQALVNICGANACGEAVCGAAAAIVTVCGAAAAIVAICGLDVSGSTGCGADVCGAVACGANLCGADGCAAAACGADACGAAACGAAGCAAAACGAAGCGAAACGLNGCAANGCAGDLCGALACAVDACPVDACGGNACAAAVSCSAKACGGNACAVDSVQGRRVRRRRLLGRFDPHHPLHLTGEAAIGGLWRFKPLARLRPAAAPR